MAITKVTNRVLADNSVSTAQLSAGAVTNVKLAADSVGTAQLSAGAVTNAKVASNAAIAGTKVDPNFGSQAITTTGGITTGTHFIGANNAVQLFQGGDFAGYIRLTPPGYGNSRYWGGWSWFDVGATRVGLATNGDIYCTGLLTAAALSVGGYKAFSIDHPVKPDHYLVHIATECPSPDLIYRGVVNLVNGKAKVNINTHYGMTPGTLSALAKDIVVVSLHNQNSFDRLKSTPVTNDEFEIICENSNSTSSVSWVVMGTRKDIPPPQIEGPKPANKPLPTP